MVSKIIGTPFLGEVYRKQLDGLMISCTYKGAVGKHDPIRGDCDPFRPFLHLLLLSVGKHDPIRGDCDTREEFQRFPSVSSRKT